MTSIALVSGVSEVFHRGGWLMYPIFLLAIALIGMLLRLLVDIAAARKLWLGKLGGESADVAAFEESSAMVAKGVGTPALDVFKDWKAKWFSDFGRRTRMIRILAGAAPLLGLLGTVTGMLKTFHGLSSSSKIDSMDTVAAGISEALVTTQTGLTFGVIAIVLLYVISTYGRNFREKLEIAAASYELSRSDMLEGGKG